MNITELTLSELSAKLQAGELTSRAATEAYLERISAKDAKINTYLTLCKEEALKAAEAADLRLKAGTDTTPLTGVPVALKDIFCTEGIRTTCASRILDNFVPPYDSTVAKKLKEAGAVMLGKLNMDEFAMGSSNENSAYGAVLNPWDTERVPGGSSGGSAAAVAASLCAASIGTDTGGSIRQPASLCGVVGMKPTYGRVSRYGMIAFASSLDQAGPLTRSVEDAAVLLQIMAGHDPLDSTSIDAPVPDYTKNLKDGVKGLRIGIPKEYFVEGLAPEVEASIKEAIEVYKKEGAEMIEVSLPHTEYAVGVYYLVATAEASSNLARFDGVKYGLRVDEGTGLLDMYKATRDKGFGAEVKRRIMLGTYSLSSGYYDAYYRKASQVRTLIRRDFDEAFKDCDIILTPTTPAAAFKKGEKTNDPLTMYLSDIFTISCNLAGIPGISIPCGMTGNALPVGLQLLAPALEEARLFRAACSFEAATGWHTKRPAI
ncbi:Aspartyl-tRNA(Asn) amidotransferase subunit A @ Glutamyl-tRNA(Gln) amidotransferase subunit A [hydrothermal vent metagenome]|uniref:glutaminyl-tRNA synthase (glutamine-hydrolyzing) n=1 Tax=hydrothermal vent metagenome TaxID=652676 RepID=A0A3B0VJK2_9ZZZZ